MKKALIIFVAFLGSTALSFAQDIITMKNGNEIHAWVQEIGINDVTYKSLDNPNGPNYRLNKSDIFMIRYANGSKEVFNASTDITTKQSSAPAQAASQSSQQSFYQQEDYRLPKKNPFTAGIMSFFVPGLGQFYNGDIAMGFVSMGVSITLNACWMSAYEQGDTGSGDTFLALALGWEIGCIINAVSRAKRINIERGYALGNDLYLKIQPAVIQSNHIALRDQSSAYGLGLSLNF
jgi:TM2 domain-containing membrane protein YozV